MPSPPASELLSGRYELGAVLGRGGMGVVRAGHDRRLRRRVAIKLLDGAVAEQPEVRRRFEGEARAAAKLSHPNVVAVFDTGEHGGTPYIVMECLPGPTLADEIERGPIPPERARRIGGEVLRALEAAHVAGIVHRDVKPGNVLLAEDDAAKVADFGIAKSTEGLDLTTAGMLIGTPAYLAPERVAGEPATVQSDLYSVGVVLYEALTGTKPYRGETPLAVAHAIQQGQHVPLDEARPGLDPALVATVRRAMEPDPGRRFATSSEMAVSLVGGAATVGMAVPDDATVAQPPPPADATVVSTPRHPPTEAMPISPRPPPSRPPAAARPRPRRPWALVVGLVAVVLVALVAVLALGGQDGGDDACQPPPTAPQPPTTATVAQPLADALDRLEETVCP